MSDSWQEHLDRWSSAGLIDTSTADSIRAWEKQHEKPGRNRFASIAFGLGGLLLIAGVLLFVAANWQDVPPGGRMALLCAAVAVFHIAGAYANSRPALAMSLHAAGTGALGAGIFLSGQTFHLAPNWPEGFLLWAIGAAVGLWLLRDWPHVLYAAILVPLWLWSEWIKIAGFDEAELLVRPAATFLVLLAIAYLTAAPDDKRDTWRVALSGLGAVGIFPAAVLLGATGTEFAGGEETPEGGAAVVIAWMLAIVLPGALAYLLRRNDAVYMVAALAWALLIPQFDAGEDPQFLALLGLYALGSVGFVLWGLKDRSPLLVNVGVIGFAVSILVFYFASGVFTKLGRALGLIVTGLIFIGGGWFLERARRSIIDKIEEEPA